MLKDHSLAKAKVVPKADPLEGLTEAEMIALRQRIDLKLKVDLSRLDLAEELGLQYRAAMVLLDSIQGDKDVPANQRAQVYNSVRSSLGEIIKQQKIVYSAERLKRFEAALFKVLSSLSIEQTRIFFDLYGDFLAEGSEAAKAAAE